MTIYREPNNGHSGTLFTLCCSAIARKEHRRVFDRKRLGVSTGLILYALNSPGMVSQGLRLPIILAWAVAGLILAFLAIGGNEDGSKALIATGGGSYAISAGLIIYAVNAPDLIGGELRFPAILAWAVACLLLAMLGIFRSKEAAYRHLVRVSTITTITLQKENRYAIPREPRS